MADTIRMKRGTTTARQAITPAVGEPFWDRSRSRLHVGDGATPGGVLVGPISQLRNVREMQYCKDAGATTVSSLGLPAPTLDGTLSSADVAGTSGCPMLEHVSAASVGAACGLISAFGVFSTDFSPTMVARTRNPAAVGNIRMWTGMTSASVDAVTDPGTIAFFGVWYASGIHGTASWRALISNIGGAGVFTEVDTGVAVAGNAHHLWWFEVVSDAAPVRVWHNGVQVAELGTAGANVPGGNRALALVHRSVATTSTARRCRWSRFALLHR